MTKKFDQEFEKERKKADFWTHPNALYQFKVLILNSKERQSK
jgi:hypothetical protein